MAIDYDLIDRWIAALESGAYPKTIGLLRTDQGYCCLGVLHELIHGKDVWTESAPRAGCDVMVYNSGDLNTEYIEEQDRDLIGLETCSPNAWEMSELTNLNDNRNTFKDVISYIKEHAPKRPE